MNHIITSSSPEKGKSRQLLLLTKGLMTTVMAILLFLVPSEVFAQKLTVSGFVKEAATNEPVPGAVVMVRAHLWVHRLMRTERTPSRLTPTLSLYASFSVIRL